MTAPAPDDGPPDILLSPPHVTDDDRAAVLARFVGSLTDADEAILLEMLANPDRDTPL